MRGLRGVIPCLVLLLVFWGTVSAEGAPEDNVYLEAIGGFGGSYMYMTYAYIGVTADAYSKDIYTASQVKVMMEETVGMLQKLVKTLQTIRATNIVDSDKNYLDSMIEVYNLLKLEAESLAAFVSSNDRTDVEKYEQARKQAWPRIKKLLGIK